MLITLDKSKLDKLTEYGLNFDGDNKNLYLDFIAEVPCALKSTEVGPKVEIGAFSYMVSGYIFATKMGRYCSVAEEVQIGRQNHPIDWVSTSPHFYLPAKEIQDISNRLINMVRDDYYKHGVAATTMKYTTIGHNVWIGHGAFISAGVNIGNGSIVAANAVVTKDVQPYTIVGGNPAKFIRYRIPEEYISDLEETRWWDYFPKQLEEFPMHDIKEFIRQFNLQELEKKDIKKVYIDSFNFEKEGLK